MDCEVYSLGMLYPPLVRKRVAGERQSETVPFQDEAGCPFEMNRGEAPDDHAVVFVYTIVDLRPVVLGNLELKRRGVDGAGQRTVHPGPRLLHVVHRSLEAPLRAFLLPVPILAWFDRSRAETPDD